MYDARYPYFIPAYSNYHHWQRPYPPVDPNTLYQSANQSQKILQEARMVLTKFAESKEFDTELMNAAQASNHEEVRRLIHSIGDISSKIEVHFNPDSIRLEFSSNDANSDCCHVIIALRW
ncbi:hypothetical protein [Gracilibacillus salinarum]|uniref:Uncharacterized protein n=1 Tax=Gracilibacillus salinarum TaxID=2932255 RepID=A0ABY4GL92_9BACI|nr:hypothetical protein [Gracilibacillus salinarum]UOQ84936.1 hypothetical protein MUN87_20175 [Gracilibacillus salinarum]